jgi:hypothetical protein
MIGERGGLEAVQVMGSGVGADSRGKVDGVAQAVAPAVDGPESATAEVERLRVTLESVLDGTIRLEYGWSPEAKAYRYWFVGKGRVSSTSYPSRIEAAVAAMESLAANASA